MSKYDPQQLQLTYERWCQLARQQAKAQQQWLAAETLLADLQTYYQSPQWIEDYEQDLTLDYSGNEASILNEDTLWNMQIERDDLARRWMRLGLDAIDPIDNTQS